MLIAYVWTNKQEIGRKLEKAVDVAWEERSRSGTNANAMDAIQVGVSFVYYVPLKLFLINNPSFSSNVVPVVISLNTVFPFQALVAKIKTALTHSTFT